MPEKNFALMGMAGVMSGVMHAPLTGIFLIAELTGGYSLLLPLWCCCLGAFHHPVWLLDAAFVLLIQFRITGIRVQFYAQYIRALARQRKEHRT